MPGLEGGQCTAVAGKTTSPSWRGRVGVGPSELRWIWVDRQCCLERTV